MTVYSTLSDLELMALIKGGDQYAFAQIYDRYFPLLLRHAADMLHDKDEAKDAVQDIFQMFWEKAAQLEIHTSLKSFLYVSTRYRVLKQIRRSKVVTHFTDALQEQAEARADTAATDDDLTEKELIQKIEAGLAKLPAKMREVFELSRIDELSHKEISKKLALSDHTVKRQISNALKIMRESLNKGLFFFI